MTLEATMERDRPEVASDTIDPARRPAPSVPARDKGLDTMLDFVDQGGLVAEQLRGLRRLFRGTFDEAEGAPIHGELVSAVDIVADCMDSMADRLDLIARQARETRDHLARGGAR